MSETNEVNIIPEVSKPEIKIKTKAELATVLDATEALLDKATVDAKSTDAAFDKASKRWNKVWEARVASDATCIYPVDDSVPVSYEALDAEYTKVREDCESVRTIRDQARIARNKAAAGLEKALSARDRAKVAFDQAV
jgi:hypothetical protein